MAQLAQHPAGELRHGHEIGRFFGVEFRNVAHMTVRYHHEMARGVRITVEHDEHPPAAMHDETLLVERRIFRRAEHASVVALRPENILHSPWSPQIFHRGHLLLTH